MQGRAQIIVDKLQDFLRAYRKAGKVLESSIITLVVECLEDAGNNICSRLDYAVFCTVVELVLQADACLDGERALFLLAVGASAILDGPQY
jgi:hypothetical protein